MEIIAEKGISGFFGANVLLMLLSPLLIISGFFTENGYIMILIGILFLLISIISFIIYKKIPTYIIKYNEKNNTLIIKDKYLVSVSRITDISYDKYLEGVIIKTRYETYRCVYIQNPIECYEKLIKIRYLKEKENKR